MAVVGAYGEVVFEVSSEVARTLDNAEWSGKANWSTHDRHLDNALTEFTGLEPDGMRFDMELSAYLGVNPMTDLVKLWEYERKGLPQPLVFGDKAYGKYRWSLISHSIKFKNYDNYGNLTRATVSVTLQEYLNV